MKITKIIFMAILLNGLSASQSVKPNGCKGPVLCDIHAHSNRGDCCKKWDVELGLLYQQPMVPDMTSGYMYSPAFTSLTAGGEYVNQEIDVIQNCYNYALGVTSSLGMVTNHDHWYIGAKFDWINSYYNTEIRDDNNPTLQIRAVDWLDPTIFVGTIFNNETDTFSWVGHLSIFELFDLDVYLSRGSFQSDKFSFDPYAGVKAVWYRDENLLSYGYPDFTLGSQIVLQYVYASFGAGPLVGFNMEYRFVDALSLFSDSELATLYGDSGSESFSVLTGSSSYDIPESRIDDHIHDFYCQFFLAVRSAIGLKFAQTCFEDKHYLVLKIGYEVRTNISYPDDDYGFVVSGLLAKGIWQF